MATYWAVATSTTLEPSALRTGRAQSNLDALRLNETPQIVIHSPDRSLTIEPEYNACRFTGSAVFSGKIHIRLGCRVLICSGHLINEARRAPMIDDVAADDASSDRQDARHCELLARPRR